MPNLYYLFTFLCVHSHIGLLAQFNDSNLPHAISNELIVSNADIYSIGAYQQNLSIPILECDSIPDESRKQKVFRAWIKTREKNKIQGLGLYKVLDEHIVLTPAYLMKKMDSEEISKTVVPYSDIESIKLKRNNKGLRGFLIGASTGFIVGWLSGIIEGDKEIGRSIANQSGVRKAEVVAIRSGFGFGIIGGVIGIAVGNTKVSINLSSQKNKKDALVKYAYLVE